MCAENVNWSSPGMTWAGNGGDFSCSGYVGKENNMELSHWSSVIRLVLKDKESAKAKNIANPGECKS